MNQKLLTQDFVDYKRIDPGWLERIIFSLLFFFAIETSAHQSTWAALNELKK